jgi:hypothetical protein
MGKRRVDELVRMIGSLSAEDRWRLIAEVTKGARLPGTGGRQRLSETAPVAVKLAKRLSTQRLSLRKIAAALAEAGHVNERGQPYNAQSVRAMLRGPQKRDRSG